MQGAAEPCNWQQGSIPQTHQGEFARAHRQEWEYPPISAASLWRRGSYSSCVWWLQKNRRPIRRPRNPTGQSNSTTRQGGGIAAPWDWASPLISARECQAGQRGEGQPIDLQQAHQFREMAEETGRSGKNGSKINLGQGPHEFREPVWYETVPCGQTTYHWDIISFDWGLF